MLLRRMNTPFRKFGRSLLPAVVLEVALASAPAPAPVRAAEAPDALEQTFGRDGVELVLRTAPAAVSDLEGVEVTLALTHPDTLEVRLPDDFSDRFQGLSLEGSYETEPVTAGGTTRREIHLRARPVPGAERLRIAPFPVRWTDPSGAGERWFPTRGIELGRRSVLRDGEATPDGIVDELAPVRVRRSPRDILRVLWLAGAGAAVLAGLILLGRWVRRRVRIARMAPRERALLELEALLARHLAERGQFKRFYVELTQVVRRYIERRHAIRAPKQTTEEFLRDAAGSGRFPPDTLARLRAFLESADLVKFAGVEATDAAARESAAAARAYLEAEPKDEKASRRTPPGASRHPPQGWAHNNEKMPPSLRGDVAERQGGVAERQGGVAPFSHSKPPSLRGDVAERQGGVAP